MFKRLLLCLKERASENTAFKEINIEMNKLKEQEKFLNAKEAELKNFKTKMLCKMQQNIILK